MSYFVRLDATTFRPTEHVGGAWDTTEQHIAPAMGLLTHVIELDRDRRRTDGLVVARASFDIWGTLPIDDVTTEVSVVRPGRTVELVEGRLLHAGRCALTARCWLLRPGPAGDVVGTDVDPLPGPELLPAWDPSTVWPGGFIAGVEVRREQRRPGRAAFWVRTPHRLVDDEPVSALAAAAGLLDIANGMSVRDDPRRTAFPNLDLTAHLFRDPVDGWLGFDTTVSFGGSGTGLTSSVLHDVHGPLGTSAQVLTLRPG